jgi:hypothetical protein
MGYDLSMPGPAAITPFLQYSNTVYLQTDRNYYLPGESIMFKAFILNDSNSKSGPVNDTLNVFLLDQEGINCATGSFPVTNSQLDGVIVLPDFLSEGNYILIASVRSKNNLSPEKMFSSIIGIRESFEPELITDLSLSDSLYEPGNLLTAQIRFSPKENKPVAVNYTYQLISESGEILNGKGKSGSDGLSTLKLQLPKFDEKESIKLLVKPSYKGIKSATGILIPTHFNYPAKTNIGGIMPVNEFKHLNIKLTTLKLQDRQDEKVQLDINVTDDKGDPIMANLSVSASNLSDDRYSFKNESIVDYTIRKRNIPEDNTNQDFRKYYTHYLLQETQSPGKQFVFQEKNNEKKLHKREESANQKKEEGYSSDRNIFDILMSVKPYHIENGKISFGISTMNSLNNQDGALIIVDGIKRGTDISVLSNIPVPDIARITASTNVMDIQRYSAMNNVGIIEITMKKNSAYGKKTESESSIKGNTLFWGPNIITDKSGNASISFLNNRQSDDILITVQGMAGNGLSGSSTIHYKGK